jgi:urease accessory protein
MPRGVAAILLAELAPRIAFAHVESGAAAGLLSGLAHPLSGGDHVLAMIAVGIWGAQLGAPAVWLLPVAFPMMMAFGGLLGLVGVQIPLVEVAIAASAVVLGVLVACEIRPAIEAAVAVVAVFAVFHGHAHGAELAPGANALTYSLGFVAATGGLHTAGIAIGLLHRWPAGRRALQGAGALVALGGIVFLGRAVGV